MKAIVDYLLANPIIPVFLSLSLGYLLGRLKIKSFSVGSTVGVLIIALIIGQIGAFKIDPLVKSIFFDLFIFTIGYEVGPSFIRSLKSTGLKIVGQSVFFAVVAFAIAMVLFKLFKVDLGEAAGIIAGALTQSAVIGTANSSINGLDISSAAKAAYNSEVAIAYALTYVFGTVGVLVFLKNIAPAILHVDLKEETKKLAEKLNFTSGSFSPLTSSVRVRGFLLGDDSPIVGKKILQIEKQYHYEFVVEAVLRKEESIPATSDLVLSPGDEIVVVGNMEEFLQLEQSHGTTEVSNKQYRNIQLKTISVMLTNAFNFHALQDMVKSGLMITSVERDGKKVTDLTTMRSGDRLTIIGTPRALQKILPEIGYEIAEGQTTDISFLTIGIVLGVLLGSIVVKAFNIPITLGEGGGALFLGIFFGWYQEKHANIGNIPGPVRWVFKSLGLNLFIAVVGLQAGSDFVSALVKMGWKVLIIGAIISILPHFITLLFGRYVLKLNAIDNIGSLTGAGTITAALNAINEETGSSLFALSYTPGYAVGNILLTILGPLTVALLS